MGSDEKYVVLDNTYVGSGNKMLGSDDNHVVSGNFLNFTPQIDQNASVF